MNHQTGTLKKRHKDQQIPLLLAQIPFIDKQVKAKGWPYLFAWAHRITALLLVIYLVFHIITLSSLTTPALFDEKMAALEAPLFIFLEWALAIPVIFHALNGGRLLAYELLEIRDEAFLLRSVVYGSLIYLLILAFFMILGNQNVPYIFFWLISLLFSLILTVPLFLSLKSMFAYHGILWKLQRLTASLLLILIPAHMLFSHLSLSTGHNAGVIIARLSNPFIKVVDSLLLLSVLYHSLYGIYSIVNDYTRNAVYKFSVLALMILFFLVLAFMGLKMTYSI